MFESLIELPDEELAEQLERQCADSPEVRRLVEELLAEDRLSQLFDNTTNGFLGPMRAPTGLQLPLRGPPPASHQVSLGGGVGRRFIHLPPRPPRIPGFFGLRGGLSRPT